MKSDKVHGLKLRYLALFSICLLGTISSVHASVPIFDEATPAPLQANLALPLSELLNNRADKEPVSGLLEIDGEQFTVTLTPRGKSRLEKCSFPPLWIEFDKSAVKMTMMHKQRRLKLVTHCKSSLKSRGYLAAEMLAYRLLNILTPASYRVRALEVTYTDTKNQKSQQHPAFLIEHKRRLAKRLDLEILEQEKISRASLLPEYAAMGGLFHYLIGNTDFSFIRGPADDKCCHNTVPMQNSAGEVLNLSYDFDSSGIVDPPYAVPASNLGLRRLTQRRYRGYCVHNPQLEQARSHFLEKKQEILDLVTNFDDIPKLNRKKTQRFIERFYTTIESDGSFKKQISARCR